jgi:dienelactone hydrolase
VADFMARSHRRSAAIGDDDSIVPVRPTVGLAAQAYVDEVLIAAFRHPDLLPVESEYGPAAADLQAARALFAERGWLADPASYHEAPPLPDDVFARFERAPGFGYERTSFTSGWEPHKGEPGRDRWLEHQANKTVRAWVAREPGRDHRKWMVCVHGFGMGQNPMVDLRGFRAGHLHRLGVNVAVLVLPLHGERASGRVRGEDLMTIDMVDSLHGMAQAAWDARRLIRWLREAEGAERIGIMGQSLGGLVASLVASLEPDLRCVVAGIPVVDLPDLFRRHSPPAIAEQAQRFGVLGEDADQVHRVVSPLAMECLVPHAGRYIYAGLGDRMSTFNQARRLWLHWDRPTLAAYGGGHVGFFFSKSVRTLVDAAVNDSLAAPD